MATAPARPYAATACRFLPAAAAAERVTVLRERDVEHCLWRYGYADVLCRAAGLDFAAGPERGRRRLLPGRVIASAVRRRSKPGLALAVIEAIAERGAAAVPAPLVRLVQACLALAGRAGATPTPDRRHA